MKKSIVGVVGVLGVFGMVQKASAGILSGLLLFLVPGYIDAIDDACQGGRRGDDSTCIVLIALGDEQSGAGEAMNYLSSDHVLVTEGMTAKNGQLVRLTEAERKAHNGNLDLYSDIVAEMSERLAKVDAKNTEEARRALVSELQSVLAAQDSRVTSLVQANALSKFVELRFGVSVK